VLMSLLALATLQTSWMAQKSRRFMHDRRMLLGTIQVGAWAVPAACSCPPPPPPLVRAPPLHHIPPGIRAAPQPAPGGRLPACPRPRPLMAGAQHAPVITHRLCRPLGQVCKQSLDEGNDKLRRLEAALEMTRADRDWSGSAAADREQQVGRVSPPVCSAVPAWLPHCRGACAPVPACVLNSSHYGGAVRPSRLLQRPPS
jgi:hypothetical protein